MRQMTPNKKRRLAILERASSEWGCSCNVKWSFALTNESQMKWLVKKGYIAFKRTNHSSRLGGKTVTVALITDEGRKYLEKQRPLGPIG